MVVRRLGLRLGMFGLQESSTPGRHSVTAHTPCSPQTEKAQRRERKHELEERDGVGDGKGKRTGGGEGRGEYLRDNRSSNQHHRLGNPLSSRVAHHHATPLNRPGTRRGRISGGGAALAEGLTRLPAMEHGMRQHPPWRPVSSPATLWQRQFACGERWIARAIATER